MKKNCDRSIHVKSKGLLKNIINHGLYLYYIWLKNKSIYIYSIYKPVSHLFCFQKASLQPAESASSSVYSIQCFKTVRGEKSFNFFLFFFLFKYIYIWPWKNIKTFKNVYIYITNISVLSKYPWINQKQGFMMGSNIFSCPEQL